MSFPLSHFTFSAHASDFSSSANGTTAVDFLNLGVGARAIGMGGAYNAVADDATALYWNPAALKNIQNNNLSVMHAPYIAGSYFDYLAYAHSFDRYGSLGVSWQYFSFGSVPSTDNSGASLGDVFPYDLAATAGYAYKFSGDWLEPLQGFSLGIVGKFIQIKAISEAETEAVDLGLLSPGYLDNRLRLAFTLDNFGEPLSFDGDRENLPLSFNAGGSWQATPKWLASWDISMPRGGSPYFALGTEYGFYRDETWNFAGRAGYNSQTSQSITGITGFSFGFGVGYGMISVDYAFEPLGGLGQAHRISLTARF